MSKLQERIEAFVHLGLRLRKALEKDDDDLGNVLSEAFTLNQWFTPENSRYALDALSRNLTMESLKKFLSLYHLPDNNPLPKRVGLVMAGNIPIAGFHDLMCTVLSGHYAAAKLSSQDRVLMQYVTGILAEKLPGTKNPVSFPDRLSGIDAAIATGSNNSSRYFEYYFSSVPHIIRKSRTSAGLLTGEENDEEMQGLCNNIFQYFGLGCRSVSKIYIPAGFDIDKLFRAAYAHREIIHHNKYANNYTYHRALFLMDGVSFLENGFLILKEDVSLPSPVSVLHYEYYRDESDLLKKLESHTREIQCLCTGNNRFSSITKKFPAVPFGETQHPALADFADGVDTMKILLGL